MYKISKNATILKIIKVYEHAGSSRGAPFCCVKIGITIFDIKGFLKRFLGGVVILTTRGLFFRS